MNENNTLCPFGRNRVSLRGRELNSAEKNWLIRVLLNKVMTTKELATYYDISINTLKGWLKRVQNNKVLNRQLGRGKRLSEEDKTRPLKARLTISTYRTTTESFAEAVQLERMEDARLQGLSPDGVMKASRTSLHRLKEEIGVVTRNAEFAEFTTEARAKAWCGLCGDVILGFRKGRDSPFETVQW